MMPASPAMADAVSCGNEFVNGSISTETIFEPPPPGSTTCTILSIVPVGRYCTNNAGFFCQITWNENWQQSGVASSDGSSCDVTSGSVQLANTDINDGC
jgi:hypothetical protein